jgi:hypothetical protein
MDISHFLERSSVSEAFRDAVRRFVRSGAPNERLVFDHRCPAVKVERTVIKILEAFPDLGVERVRIDARSGCEFFRGTATIDAVSGTRVVRFEWNCRWKAEQLGWTDWFGLSDQTRAAREFGHDCFQTWSELPDLAATVAEPVG